MRRHPEVSELLERYMEASGAPERWVTVQELRAFFSLDESAGPAFSGFLQRIHHGPYFACRYRVIRMEKFCDTKPPYRIVKRYLVRARPAPRATRKPAGDRSETR